MNLVEIDHALRKLRLSGMADVLETRLRHAQTERLAPIDLISTLVSDELLRRQDRLSGRRIKAARFRDADRSLDSFDFDFNKKMNRALIYELATARFVAQREDVLLLGPPGTGKSHLAAALGYALVANGFRVLFAHTTDLVQKLQVARCDLQLEAAIAKLDKYHLLILDDIAYVTKDQAETSVIFELIAARYERRSMFITANQPFGEWGRIFPDQVMTLAAVDRLVHHATIFEMNVESYRRRAAVERKRGPGRPPTRATLKSSS
jgi:DNA replication protein DnaC